MEHREFIDYDISQKEKNLRTYIMNLKKFYLHIVSLMILQAAFRVRPLQRTSIAYSWSPALANEVTKVGSCSFIRKTDLYFNSVILI